MKVHKESRIRRPVVSLPLSPEGIRIPGSLLGHEALRVNAAPDGSLPVDETISLLAMQCVLRAQTPADFRVMLSVAEELLNGFAAHQKLINSCLPTVMPIQIASASRRCSGAF